MTAALHNQILERLFADEKLDPAVLELVDAACAGDAELAAAVAKLGANEGVPARSGGHVARETPPGVYLSSLKVAGFRGIGAEQTLNIAPGPGLTILIGRNGSRKSSFAEGLETLLTNEARRWAGRAKEWKGGWKNLHACDNPCVEATFAVEGGDAVVVRRSWGKDSELEASELRVRRGSAQLAGLGALGWSEALASFRPFLSYAELGVLLSKPSELYDSLKGILGLEYLTTASKRLSAALKVREDRKKKVKEQAKQLQARLEQLPGDPRAQQCLAAIKGRSWKLSVIEQLILVEGSDGGGELVRSLRELSKLAVPSLQDVSDASSALRAALAAYAELAGTSAEQNAELAALLEQALHYCKDTAGACPVCLRELPADWSSTARVRLAESQELAQRVRTAVARRDGAAKALRSMVTDPPRVLDELEALGLPVPLREAWRAWADVPRDPVALCEHAEAKALDLHAALEPLVAGARTKLEGIESAWLPVARDVASFLQAARALEAEAAVLKALEAADDWLKEAEEQLRDERFTPIAARSQHYWSVLRQQSNVDLAAIKLDGTGNRRRVELNVSVDGREGVAVSVMSQGELNALSLSLFLPRMMLAESPFRFLVIDDPVQAMDSHKVDGLAHVLQDVAKTRQVIVLTHDARLLEATRRLKIDATILEVQRRADSVVEVQCLLDPVERHLKDAIAIAKNEREFGPKLVARTVPAFCRLAIESACVEAIRRGLLARGVPHNDVEEKIEDSRGIHALAELAIQEKTSRQVDVFSYLKNKLGDQAADAFRSVKEGAHGNFRGSAEDLVRASREIARAIG